MRERIEILKDLVYFNNDLSDIAKELSEHSWDCDESILTIKKIDLINILEKNIQNQISFTELENWANLIECRDGLSFQEEQLKEIIFEIANKEINKQITKERIKEILSSLKQNSFAKIKKTNL